jgi:hypothetical protein
LTILVRRVQLESVRRRPLFLRSRAAATVVPAFPEASLKQSPEDHFPAAT